MPLVQLSIDLPETTWIHEVSTAHGEATFRVLAAIPDDDVGFALVQITTPEVEAVVRSMARNDLLTDIEPLQRGTERAIVQIETTAPLLLLSAQASGIPIQPPVVIRDGTARVELRTSNDRLSTLGEELERFGFSYTVESIYDDADPEGILSERQRELIRTAVEEGYYDTPRRCTLTELADSLDIAKSTCSETLHRAESIIIRRFAKKHLAGGTPPLETPPRT